MKKLFRLGISEQYEVFKNNAISASNVVALFIFLFTLLFGVALFFYAPKVNYITLFLLISVIIVFVLNSQGLADVGRVVMVFTLALSASLYNALPLKVEESLFPHFYLLQLTLLLLPWAVADFRERSVFWISLSIVVFFVLFQGWIRDSFSTEYQSADLSHPVVTYSMYIISILSAFLLLYIPKFRSLKFDVRKSNTEEEISSKENEMHNKQQELQKQIDEINQAHEGQELRSWVAQNLTQINDILRSTDKGENIFPELVEEISNIMEAAQVAIYIYDDESSSQQKLVLEGFFAYDRIKYAAQEINYGDGLIGQCCIDRTTMYLDNLPTDYLNMDSGMGDEPPKNLAIIPLMDEQELTGVIEILSKKPFTEREKGYLEQLSKSIASFVNSNKINVKIKELIEQNQSQAEEMRAQEEEMLQNMEELQATQEEMTRKEKEYQETIEQLEKKLAERS